MKSRFLSASFLQFMGTIGSGIFVLPFLFHSSNLIFAGLFLVYLVFVTAVLNQFYVDIIINTSGDHQLAGYASIYLGHNFRLLTALNLLLLSFGAITTYTKLFIRFFTLLFPTIPSNNISIFLILLLFVIYLFRRYLDYNLFIIAPVFMLLIPLVLFLFSFNYPPVNFNSSMPNLGFYGAALFALSGFTIIPEVQEIFGPSGSHLRRKLSLAVISGLLLAAISYSLYIYSVIAISGSALSIDSVAGLVSSLPVFSKIMAVFGMVVTLRASFGFLVVLRELFYRDLKIPKVISDYLPLLFPLLTLTLGGISLITIISLTGNFTIFISALIICLIRLKIRSDFTSQFFCLMVIISLSMGLIINLLF
jgi:hypothetical protein